MLRYLVLFKKAANSFIIVFLLTIMPGFAWSQKKKQKQQSAMDIIIDTTKKVDIIDVVKSKFKFSEKTIKRSPGKKYIFLYFLFRRLYQEEVRH